MQFKRAWKQVDGVLLLDKPIGLTSNDALQKARRLFSAAKGGHTGTLDPLATGLLPLCFGEATKFSADLLDADKVARLAKNDPPFFDSVTVTFSSNGTPPFTRASRTSPRNDSCGSLSFAGRANSELTSSLTNGSQSCFAGPLTNPSNCCHSTDSVPCLRTVASNQPN